jgi:hypothetical protein
MSLLDLEGVRNLLLDLNHVLDLPDDYMHVHIKLSVNSKDELRFSTSGSQHPGGIKLI